MIRPHVEDAVPLVAAARNAGVPLRSAQRWLACYREGGLVALGRPGRSDRRRRRLPSELVMLIEGLTLGSPRPTIRPGDGTLYGDARRRRATVRES